MKHLNILLTILALCFFSNLTSAQVEKKADQMAESRVQEIDKMITAINPDAGLTIEQKAKIKELHIKRTQKIQDIKQNNAFTEQEKEVKITALRKEFGRVYSKEILTQEQRQAKKVGKEQTAKGGK